MNDNIKVRIAPSPTGYLHVGTARTAIFNWLFARRYGGKFVVRIEDTDIERSKPELIQPILDALSWLGINWDEEPVYQSKRMDRYTPYIDRLLENGFAYRCFCTPEELQAERNQAMKEKGQVQYSKKCKKLSQEEINDHLDQGKSCAIRLSIPEGETSYNDLVGGVITKQNTEIEDFVICRGDGRAVYNLAVVIDDHEMGISHVIRGNDHISNTFKQIHIYRALGLKMPEFAHVPLILRPDKKKVSKRLGDKDVAEYGNEGILPEALFNFLSLLGWSPKDDREYLPPDELIRIFTIDNINKSNPVFDEQKLLSLNQQYIMKKPDHELAKMVAPLLVAAEYTSKYWLETRWEYLMQIIAMLKERAVRLIDFVEKSEYFFTREFKYDEEAAGKNFNIEGRKYLEELIIKFESIDNFNKDNLEKGLTEVAEKLEVKRGNLIHPTRLAVSGVPHGPGLFDMLVAIGKDEVILRMRRAIEFIDKTGE
ncbi:MAG: glutamate--tRNA ligase [Candidatus Zixiibacteriota bacterium]